MEIPDAIKAVLRNGGIENIFLCSSPMVDNKFIEENYSVIISEKKYLNLWLIELQNSVETGFSMNNNLCEEEYSIKGYFGFNYEQNSFNNFILLAEKVVEIIRLNPTLNGECIAISKIEKSEYSKKMFCNILCHCQEIIVKLNRLKNRREQ